MNNAPRRYFADAIGRRVLVELTFEETHEFEVLDNSPSSQQRSAHFPYDRSDALANADQERWLVLYSKHDSAWRQWIAQHRDEGARRRFAIGLG